VDDYLKSVAMARAVHLFPNALNVPELRVLGIPIAIGSLWSRRWEIAIASGTVVFVVVLFFDRWASRGYWLAVTPILGIAFEAWAVRHARDFVRILRGGRATASLSRQPVAVPHGTADGLTARGDATAPVEVAPGTLFTRAVPAPESEQARGPEDAEGGGSWREGS
jgi:hypothetical protein